MRLAGMAVLVALALPLAAAAAPCEVAIDSDDQMEFDRDELRVGGDCEEITVTLTHSGELGVDSMGHNWVLTRTGDWEEVAEAGLGAGRQHGYLPPDDDRIIAHTGLIGGGEETSVTFPGEAVERGEAYTFFCTFPGHARRMNGTLVVE